MKKNRKKQKAKKAAISTPQEEDIPVIGLKVESTAKPLGAGIRFLVRAVMFAADSQVVFNSSRDLTKPHTMKEVNHMMDDEEPFVEFIGGVVRYKVVDEQENKATTILTGQLFVQTKRTFQDIKMEVERQNPAHWSVFQSENTCTARKQIACLLYKDPKHEYLTCQKDYARRIKQHLLDQAGKSYKIYISPTYQQIGVDDVVHMLGIETEYFQAKEVSQKLRDHPTTSLSILLDEDQDNDPNHYGIMMKGSSVVMMKCYIGLLVSGLASTDVEELRGLVQNMGVMSMPKDLDATIHSEKYGEYVILTDSDNKEEVLKKVNHFLDTSDTVNRMAFPGLYPDGPCVLEDCMSIISPGYRAMVEFHSNAMHFCQLEKEEAKARLVEAVLPVLVAMKRHPNDWALQRHACFTLRGIGHYAEGPTNIVRIGGIQAIVGLMKNYTEDNLLQFCLLDLMNVYSLGVFGNVEATDAILHTMTQHSNCFGIQHNGLYALDTIFRGNGGLQSHLMDCVVPPTAINVCVAAMTAFKYIQPIQSLGCVFLSWMCLQPDTLMVVVRAGGARAILGAASDSAADPLDQVQSCNALGHFLDVEDLKKECFESILEMMKLHPSNGALQETACLILANAACGENCDRELFMESCSISCIGMALSEHPKNPRVLEPSCQILSALMREAEDCKVPREGAEMFKLLVKAASGISVLGETTLCMYICSAILRFVSFGDTSACASSVDHVMAFVSNALEAHGENMDIVFVCLGIMIGIGVEYVRGTVSLATASLSFLDHIIGSMKANQSDEKLQEGGSRLLFSLTQRHETRILAKLMELDAISGILYAVRNFPDNKQILNQGGTAAFRVLDYEDEVNGQG